MTLPIRIILLILFMWTLYFDCTGQVLIDTYQDSSDSDMTDFFMTEESGFEIIVSGVKEDGNQAIPIIAKLDTLGKITWSTSNYYRPITQEVEDISFKEFDDGHIYVVSIEDDGSAKTKFLWKVESETGKLIWRTILDANIFNRTVIQDYDSLSYLVMHYYDSGMLAVSEIGKSTGSTLSTSYLDPPYGNFDLVVDQQKNCYVSVASRVTKYNKKYFDTFIWETTFPDILGHETEMERLHIDKEDRLFTLNIEGTLIDRGYIKRLDTENGEVLWSTRSTFWDAVIADWHESLTSLYPTYTINLFGGSPDYLQASKIDKNTGLENWRVAHQFIPLTTTSSSSEEAGLSIDADCDGNLFYNGYYGGNGFGPAAWGIMSLHDASGAIRYGSTITFDSLVTDMYSEGRFVHFIGNSGYFIGDLETAPFTSVPYIVKTDNTGNEEFRTPIPDSYQGISSVIDLVQSNDTIFSLIQEGRNSVVKAYDQTGTLLWTNRLSGDHAYLSGAMKVLQGSVVFTSSKVQDDTLAPYLHINNAIGVHVRRLARDDGIILSQDSISFSKRRYHILDLESDDLTAHWLVDRNGSLYLSKWASGGISTSNIIEPTPIDLNTDRLSNRMIDESADSLLYIGNQQVLRINKASMSTQVVGNLYSDFTCFDILQRQDTLFACGNYLGGSPVVMAINRSTPSIIWQNSYGVVSGGFYQIIQADASTAVIMTETNSNMGIKCIVGASGSEHWTYESDSQVFYPTSPLDMAIDATRGQVILAGQSILPSGSSNAVIQMIDLSGSFVDSIIVLDEVLENSRASVVLDLPDSVFWFGGAWNTDTPRERRGFIMAIDTSSIINSVGDEAVEYVTLLSIHPNPSSAQITLNGLGAEPFSYQLIDLRGALCATGSDRSERTLDVSDLRSGIYYLRTTQGSQVHIGKFMIAKNK